ncbi:MAG: hypothetical protein JW881_15630 [Spirochaetales bacterium]|nr:hypothetical protein [Spirochaetales bacterium]
MSKALVGYWSFDEGRGTSVHDASDNGNHGVLRGNPLWTKGVIGGGLQCDPSDGVDYVELPDSVSLTDMEGGSFTICAWFMPLSVPEVTPASGNPSFGIVMQEGYHIGLAYDYAMKFSMYHFLEGGVWAGVTSETPLEPGTFYHIAGSVDRENGFVRLYVNGLLFGERFFDPGAIAQPLGRNRVRIGIASPSNPDYPYPAHGIIDEVRIYSDALSHARITALADNAAKADITVFVSDTERPFRNHAYGVLDSLSNSEPPDEYIVPLKPSIIRSTNLDVYERARRLHAKFLYFFPVAYAALYLKGGSFETGIGDGRWPGDGGDWDAWETCVGDTVKKSLSKGYDGVVWDIWNEPDIRDFWKRSWKQYLETYRRGVVEIKKLDPDALVTGPSLSVFDREKIIDFLDYASRNNVLPDILNWHELTPSMIDTIPGRVQSVKTHVAERAYPVSRIMITEVIDASYQHSPGHAVGVMAKIHRAGIEAAAKSCWTEPFPNDGISNCGICSLDGLLDPVHGKPRSVWWTFREYADVAGYECDVVVSNTPLAVEGVAAYDPEAGTVSVIVGRYMRRNGEARDVRLAIASLPPDSALNGMVRVVIKKIPYTAGNNLSAPVAVADYIDEVSGGRIVIVLPEAGEDDAYIVVLSPVQ